MSEPISFDQLMIGMRLITGMRNVCREYGVADFLDADEYNSFIEALTDVAMQYEREQRGHAKESSGE